MSLTKGKREYILSSYNRYLNYGKYFNLDHVEKNRHRLSMIVKKNYWFGGYGYLDLNQKQISGVLGISEVTFNRVINNKFKLSFDMMIKIAWLCDCSIDKIIEFERELGNINHLGAYLKKDSEES